MSGETSPPGHKTQRRSGGHLLLRAFAGGLTAYQMFGGIILFGGLSTEGPVPPMESEWEFLGLLVSIPVLVVGSLASLWIYRDIGGEGERSPRRRYRGILGMGSLLLVGIFASFYAGSILAAELPLRTTAVSAFFGAIVIIAFAALGTHMARTRRLSHWESRYVLASAVALSPWVAPWVLSANLHWPALVILVPTGVSLLLMTDALLVLPPPAAGELEEGEKEGTDFEVLDASSR